jgi:CBS-domain-containing membrane protein
MTEERESFKTTNGEKQAQRQRLPLASELTLAALPTATVLLVFAFVEVLTEQRLLFASLASSAFLIYLDPDHGTNRVRTLVVAQMLAAMLGLSAFLLIGPGYFSGGIAMIITIVLMVLLDAVHPPAVSTSLSFAFRAGEESNLVIFFMAVLITAMLVMLQRGTTWLLIRYTPLKGG